MENLQVNKYQFDLDKLFRFATLDSSGNQGVNNYIFQDLEKTKNTLQELVDKATPKKPIGERLDRLCPNCEKRLYWDDETCDYIYEDYCIHCGQHLDWSENG